MKTSNNPQFNQYYAQHCKHLKLKGLQPKTIDAYTRSQLICACCGKPMQIIKTRIERIPRHVLAPV